MGFVSLEVRPINPLIEAQPRSYVLVADARVEGRVGSVCLIVEEACARAPPALPVGRRSAVRPAAIGAGRLAQHVALPCLILAVKLPIADRVEIAESKEWIGASGNSQSESQKGRQSHRRNLTKKVTYGSQLYVVKLPKLGLRAAIWSLGAVVFFGGVGADGES